MASHGCASFVSSYMYRGVLTYTMMIQTGETDEEGTILQGGCGVLYYQSDESGSPVVTTKGIELVCSTSGTNEATNTERALFISETAS